MPKSSASVLTSEECGQELNEKQRKKAEDLKQKEIRKAEHERKKEEKIKEFEKRKELKKAKETSKFNTTYHIVFLSLLDPTSSKTTVTGSRKGTGVV